VTALSPSQQEAFDALAHASKHTNVLALWCRDGMGRTTVLRELHRKMKGAYLSANDIVQAMGESDPFSLEETFHDIVLEALEEEKTVFVDDFGLFSDVVGDCNYHYPRSGLLSLALTSLCETAEAMNRRLVFGCGRSVPDAVSRRGFAKPIEKFREEDYAHLLEEFLGKKSAGLLDAAKIHRFAPRLTAHQLKDACTWGSSGAEPDTDTLIDYLRTQRMASNVSLGEVAEVDLRDLKGVDDVIESLEANIIVPLENDALATELGIRPKRGVLLAGPPGTGKTTVGRALAHRLKSKFFLIDGTFISGTQNFYQNVAQVFEAAQQNAPSIIFIDDSDVIFESGEEHGLYRYLLTMLDGLESQSAGRVCVMLTAMDVGNLPPALVRSGRVELWLETRLPDLDARLSILSDHLAMLPNSMGAVEVERVAEAAEGLTGADLKRLVDDGKLLYAYDRVRGRELRPLTGYFLDAIETVRRNKEKYAEAEERARAQRPVRPTWFDPMSAAAAAMAHYSADVDDD
jgi:ATP-dependent 26S proteasome regulatory subunit